MMIRLDHQSYHQFYDPLFDERYPQLNDKEKQEWLNILLGPIKMSHTDLGYNLIDQLEENAQSFGIPHNRPLDLAFPGAFMLMGKWRKDISDSITLIHDASSRMAEVFPLWGTFVHPYPPPSLSKFNMTLFPIKLSETLLSDSKDWVGLQLADILAGATIWWAKWLMKGKSVNDTYGKLLDSIIPNFFLFSNWLPPKVAQDFEKLGLTEEEASKANELSKELTSFHRLRQKGYTFFIFPDDKL